MKKVILTEQQIEKLMTHVISEAVPAVREFDYSMDDGRFRMKCQFNFDYDHSDFITYKNGEIRSIDYGYSEVSFMIDTQNQSYGITALTVTDIRIPKEIKTKITYYPEGYSSDDEYSYENQVEEDIIIPLDTKRMEIDDSNYYIKYFGLNQRINVDVFPDGNGGLIGKKIEVNINNFKVPED